jgi:chaperone BCS1
VLNTTEPHSIILLEDIDGIFKGRESVQEAKENRSQVTFSGLLNALDGVRSQEGRILIMTTNHKEHLDPALMRPGRADR